MENAAPAVVAQESTESVVEPLEGEEQGSETESESTGDIGADYERWLKNEYGNDKKTVETKPTEKPVEEVKEEPKVEAKSEKIKIKDKEYSKEELESALGEVESAKAEYTKIHRQAEQLVELLKTNPGQILNKLGVSKDIIEEWYYKTHIEPDLLTPEQRQAKTDQEELTKYRSEATKRQAAEEEANKERTREQHRQEWQNRIQKALDESDLPKSDWSIQRIAGHLKQALSEGKNIQPSDVIPLVKKEFEEAQKSMISQLPPDKLKELLGEETMTKLRQHEAEKFKQDKFENKTPIKNIPKKPSKPKRKYSNAYDLLEDL